MVPIEAFVTLNSNLPKANHVGVDADPLKFLLPIDSQSVPVAKCVLCELHIMSLSECKHH